MLRHGHSLFKYRELEMYLWTRERSECYNFHIKILVFFALDLQMVGCFRMEPDMILTLGNRLQDE